MEGDLSLLRKLEIYLAIADKLITNLSVHHDLDRNLNLATLANIKRAILDEEAKQNPTERSEST